MSDWLKINQCALDVGKKNFHRVGTIPGTSVDGVFPPWNFNVCTILTSSSLHRGNLYEPSSS